MVKKYPEITHIFNEHMKGGDGTVEVIPSVVQGAVSYTHLDVYKRQWQGIVAGKSGIFTAGK